MINLAKIPDFSLDNFPEDPDEYAEPQLLYNLQTQRNIFGKPIIPSPVGGALARTAADQIKSQHYADPKKKIKSKAVDVFPEGDPLKNLILALSSQLWGGLGVYFDTEYGGKTWVMFHFDIRDLGEEHKKKMTLLWFRIEGAYFYPQYSQGRMEQLFKIFQREEFKA